MNPAPHNPKGPMKPSADFAKVRSAAQHLGYERCELLLESFLILRAAHENRLNHCESGRLVRTHLKAEKAGVAYEWVGNAMPIDQLVNVLELGLPNASLTTNDLPVFIPTKPSTWRAEINQVLSLLHRTTMNPHSEVRAPSLHLYTVDHEFAWFGPGGEYSHESSQQASFHAHWQIPSRNQRERHQFSLYQRNLPQLLERLRRQNELAEAVQATVVPAPRWPVPGGNLSLLWQPVAHASLWLPLVRLLQRASRGDLVATYQRFCQEFPLPFEVNAEGRHLFSVAGKGAQTWNEVSATGIRVEEIRFQQFDPVTLHSVIEVQRSSLLHGGRVGEALEPFNLTLPLPQLLQSVVAVAPVPLAQGFVSGDHFRQDVLEILCPAALSENVAVTGSVPLSHYF